MPGMNMHRNIVTGLCENHLVTRNSIVTVAVVLLYLLISPPVLAEIYTWTDSNGFLHVTDDLSKVPSAYRQKDSVPTGEEIGRQKIGSQSQGEAKNYQSANITVDYSKELGKFSPYLFGTISAPYYDKRGFELTGAAGFKMIEIGVQIENAPIPSDPGNPLLYNFTAIDKKVKSAIDAGEDPILWFAPKEPGDVEKYATYAKNVVLHYTQGWGNGYYWKLHIFRFGNEPDNFHYWSGTHEEFFKKYAAWAKALKGIDSSFILDSPGVMNIHKTTVGQYGLSVAKDLNPFAIEFLDYLKSNSVPLDIFSFHAYSPSPHDFYDFSSEAYALVRKYHGISPLYDTPHIGNDEWNLTVADLYIGSYHEEFDTAWMAAHNINSLTNMVENNLFLSIRYGGGSNGGQGGCHDFLLTDCNGNGKPAYYAFKAFNNLVGTMRLETSGGDKMNFAALSGKKNGEITIIFSNFDFRKYREKYSHQKIRAVQELTNAPTYNSYNLSLLNLPWDPHDNLIIEHYLVDDSHSLELIESKPVSGSRSLALSGDINAPSVHMVKIRKK
jgi:hypothetical protein